jgi:hypothetical protein
MAGHEEKNSGWGKRDQDFGDPHRDPALDEGPNNVPDSMTNKPGQDRGAVAGAHGDRPPHQDIKPGTRLDIEKNT